MDRSGGAPAPGRVGDEDRDDRRQRAPVLGGVALPDQDEVVEDPQGHERIDGALMLDEDVEVGRAPGELDVEQGRPGGGSAGSGGGSASGGGGSESGGGGPEPGGGDDDDEPASAG